MSIFFELLQKELRFLQSVIKTKSHLLGLLIFKQTLGLSELFFFLIYLFLLFVYKTMNYDAAIGRIIGA